MAKHNKKQARDKVKRKQANLRRNGNLKQAKQACESRLFDEIDSGNVQVIRRNGNVEGYVRKLTPAEAIANGMTLATVE